MFQPGIIQPLYGVKSRTPLYNVFYSVSKPLLPLLQFAFPDHVLTTEQIDRAMLAVANHGFPKRILESKDIRAAANT
jgi:hypothetical protein